MATHNNFGKIAENLAAQYLTAKKYQVIDKNWRSSRLEADIIAKKDNILIIVEVKARKNIEEITFDEIISLKKQKNLITLAEKYLEEKNIDLEIRFDAIFVLKNKGKIKISHIENAFYSTL